MTLHHRCIRKPITASVKACGCSTLEICVEKGQAGAGYLAADKFAGRNRRRHVVASRDHQRRALDPGQQLALVECAQRLAAGEIAPHRGCDQHRLHVRRYLRLAFAKIRRQPARDDGVGHRRDAAFLHRLDAIEPVGRIGIVASGVGENNPVEALGCVGAKPLSDHATHRQPAPVHLPDVEVIEDGQHIAAETFHRIGAGCVRAFICGSHICKPQPSEFDSIRVGPPSRPSTDTLSRQPSASIIGIETSPSVFIIKCLYYSSASYLSSSEASSRSIRACETP